MEAESGPEALQVLRNNEVAIVLCDIRMPGMTGLELYERLSAAPETRVPPFLFMTGDRTTVGDFDSRRRSARQALHAGGSGPCAGGVDVSR